MGRYGKYTASRMESHSEDGYIQITGDVGKIIKDEFECRAQGVIKVKGKGSIILYFLMGVKE